MQAEPVARAGADVLGCGIALLGHDLRSAVADVLGGIQLLEERDWDPEGREQLERVRAASESLGRLIGEAVTSLTGEPFLAMDLAETHPLVLTDVLRDIERRWRGHVDAAGMTLRTDLAPDLPVLVSVDRLMLERILSNLIDNAAKYSEAGTITLTVERQSNNDVRFTVSDEGPGFASAALHRLFDFRARAEGTLQPGSGMGLHIAKSIADRLGGRLTVSNILPKAGGAPLGAEVSLVLPEESWRPAGREHRNEDVPDLRGLNVLIAEDNSTNQIVVRRMIEHMGATCILVEDGRTAMETLEQGGIDLALIDIEMPLMSGIDVISRTRAISGPQARIPILAVTAYVLGEHREAIYRAGADGVIAKPIMGLGAFGEAVSAVLRKASPQRTSTTVPNLAGAQVGGVDAGRLNHLLELAGPDGREELLERLRTDLKTAAHGLKDAVRDRDLTHVRSHTHVLISLSGAVGAEDVQSLMEAMNDAAHHADWDVLTLCAPLALERLAYVRKDVDAASHALGGSVVSSI